MDLDTANDPAIDEPQKIAEITKDSNTAIDIPVPSEGTVGGFSPLSKRNRALTSPSQYGSRAVFLIFFVLIVTAILLAVIALSIKPSRSEIKKSAQGEFPPVCLCKKKFAHTLIDSFTKTMSMSTTAINRSSGKNNNNSDKLKSQYGGGLKSSHLVLNATNFV